MMPMIKWTLFVVKSLKRFILTEQMIILTEIFSPASLMVFSPRTPVMNAGKCEAGTNEWVL